MKLDRWKTFWIIAIIGFFGGSVALVFTGDDTGGTASAAEQTEKGEKGDASTFSQNSKEPHAAEPVIEKTADGCLADAATLADLRRQKAELESRQKDLAAREAEFKAREQALNEQVKGLAAARDDIEKIETSHKAESDAKVAKLVEAVEGMNPKAASQLLGSLDEGLATATMARLSTGKLAKVLNVMDPARSTKLSELLAGVVRAKPRTVSHDTAVTTTERTPSSAAPAVAKPRTDGPSKGGDTNDGKSHEQASSRSTAGGESNSPSR